MTSNTISAALRREVIVRAKGCCEYCLLNQKFSICTHEVDHVIAVKHDGQTIAENLALTCLHCNRHKGSDLTTFDPFSGELVRLFNPRTQKWKEHFRLNDAYIEGITATGRATVKLLRMNDYRQFLQRQVLQNQGQYP